MVFGRQGVFGLLSVGLGFLGLLFFWVQPLGEILGGAGILAGVLGVGASYSTGGRPLRQATTGLIVSFVAVLVSLSMPLILREDRSTRILEPERQALPTPTD